MVDEEIWKDIPDWEGFYQVSDQGRIRSLDRWRTISLKQGVVHALQKGIILKPTPCAYGYLQCSLSKNGFKKQTKVHLLVAEVFLNIKPDVGFNIDHKDNNKLNNCFENLQKISIRENTSKDKKNKTSLFRGVSWAKTRNKWVVYIHLFDYKLYLGIFVCEKTASLTYEKALIKYLSNKIYYQEEISHLSNKEKRDYLVN